MLPKRFLQFGCAIGMTLAIPNGSMAKSADPEPGGLAAADMIMHPGANLSLAYDVKDSQGYDDGLLDLGIHFKTRLQNEDTRVWNNEISLKYRQYWGLGKAGPNAGIDVTASSQADLFKKSIIRVAPGISYAYLSDPEDDNLRQDFKNHHLAAAASFYIQPGEGAIFSEMIAYRLNGRFYAERSDISNLSHKIESVTRWNFLPQTSMSLAASVTIGHFLEENRGTSFIGTKSVTKNATSFPFRIKYGLQGLLLERLSFATAFGYAYVYYDNSNKAVTEHMFIMNARLAYSFNDAIDLAIEYKKDFENSTFGDYYKFHRADITFGALWFDHLQTKAQIGVSAFDFKSPIIENRHDTLIHAQADIYYHFFAGLKLGMEYRLRFNQSNVGNAEYAKHLMMINFAYEY